jgi:hypothetical protein
MDSRLRLVAYRVYQNEGSVGGTIRSFLGKTRGAVAHEGAIALLSL